MRVGDVRGLVHAFHGFGMLHCLVGGARDSCCLTSHTTTRGGYELNSNAALNLVSFTPRTCSFLASIFL